MNKCLVIKSHPSDTERETSLKLEISFKKFALQKGNLHSDFGASPLSSVSQKNTYVKEAYFGMAYLFCTSDMNEPP